LKELIHVNSPLTAIIALCYIEKAKHSKRDIHVTFSRVKSLSEWFTHLPYVTLTGRFSEEDLFNSHNTLIIPHDYVDGARYTKNIQNGKIKNIYYIEEGDLSWLGSRYHHDRRRVLNLFRICDIPIIGKLFDKLVYSRDSTYITTNIGCFDFASDNKKYLVELNNDFFVFYKRHFKHPSKILLTGKVSYEQDIFKFLATSEISEDYNFYIKPHPVVLSNKVFLKNLSQFLCKMDLYDRLLLEENVSLELESLFSDIEIYGSASTLERYEKFFPYRYFKLG
jgi:hypothetical protein